ncbi:hypothetical protein T484DRAFT_1786148 [Baffinella frigidus]|nr:hypothetical protein T484DRAFT_1786148 [Cryptophyta sp. CCMP2293]
MAKGEDHSSPEKQDVASLLVRTAMLEEHGNELENKLLHSEKDLESTKALLEQQCAFSEGREADALEKELELKEKLKRVQKESEYQIMSARAEAAAQVERMSQQAAEAESNLQEQSDTSSSEHERFQSLLVAANDRAEHLASQLSDLSLEKEALQRELEEAVSSAEKRLREAEEKGAAAIGELETKLTELRHPLISPPPLAPRPADKCQRLSAEHSLANEHESKLQVALYLPS